MTLVNHADENAKVGSMLGTAGMAFLSQIVDAKNSGQKLPKFLDKVAGLVTGGQQKAVQIAKEEVKKEATNKMGWIIAAVLVLVIIFLIVRLKK
jgi:hypothetical protein